MKSKAQRAEKIRQRASYSFWGKWIKFLIARPSMSEILQKIDNQLDGRHAYGSEHNALCSTESLNLALKDNGVA